MPVSVAHRRKNKTARTLSFNSYGLYKTGLRHTYGTAITPWECCTLSSTWTFYRRYRQALPLYIRTDLISAKLLQDTNPFQHIEQLCNIIDPSKISSSNSKHKVDTRCLSKTIKLHGELACLFAEAWVYIAQEWRWAPVVTLFCGIVILVRLLGYFSDVEVYFRTCHHCHVIDAILFFAPLYSTHTTTHDLHLHLPGAS